MTARSTTHKENEIHTAPEAEAIAEALRATRNVFQRMAEAAAIIGQMPFAKDQSNSQYKSIPIDTMRRAVREACTKAGLVHVGPLDLHYEVSTKDGRMKVYSGTCVFRYVNIDDPQDFVDYPTMGEAADTGDKGTGKFITNCVKNHYKVCWDIGEQGKDDIDSYSNEELEDEADRIAERRAKRQQAVASDPFFGKPAEAPRPVPLPAAPSNSEALVALRKQVGEFYAKGGQPMQIVNRYKEHHGAFGVWDEATLKACLDDCRGVNQ